MMVAIKHEDMLDTKWTAMVAKQEAIDTKSEHSQEILDSENISLPKDLQSKVDAVVQGMEEPYNPKREQLPGVPCYHPAFKRVEALCEMVFTQADAVLKGSNYHDSCTERLVRSIDKVRYLKYPDAKRIAFIGDSGVGKSSLINTLLSCSDLCAQGSSGSACTCVITEYRQASPSQETPFEAEIEFYDASEVGEMLREYYDHYYKYFINRPSNLEDDELHVLELHANTAYDVFRAMFTGRDEFETEESTKEFLHSETPQEGQEIHATLSQWALDLVRAEGGAQNPIKFGAESPEKMRAKLDRYILAANNLEDDEEESVAAYWPLVRMVHVGLDSKLLKMGLIIADLPGLSDINTSRKRSTLQYLRTCTFQIIVAPIKRVLTDTETHSKIKAVLEQAGKNKVLICTMIDDISSDTKARTVARSSEAVKSHEILYRIYKERQEVVKKLTRSMKNLKGAAKGDLELNLSDNAKMMRILESLVLDSLVIMRNDKIKYEIAQKYLPLAESARYLRVHFISNQDYLLHLEGYTDSKIPLPITTTGVVDLRYRLLSIPAADKLEVLTYHFTGHLRSILDSMTIWSQQSAFERSKELRKLVEKPKQDLAGIIAAFTIEQKAILGRTVLQPLVCASQKEWKQHGIKVSQAWGNMHAASFAAWCRKYGAHKTKKYEYRDWNDELMKPLRPQIGEIWSRFKKAMMVSKGDLKENLFALVDNIRTDLGGVSGVSLLPMEPFLASLSTRKNHFLRELETMCQSIDAASRKAHDAIVSCEHDSALMEAMIPIYDNMSEVTDTAQHVQRTTLLKDAMSRAEPFKYFVPRVEELLGATIQDQENELLVQLKSIFDGVLQDYDMMFVVEELPDKERDALKEEVKEFIDYADKQYHGPMTEALAKATSDSA